MESALLSTADGHELTADIESPDGASVGGVVVSHPHPQYGGNRFNPVVDAVFRHLPTIGFTTLRFDFRAEFDGGVGERSDVIAALDELEGRSAGPLAVVGYSFGAAVALNTDDDRIETMVAIAPPLTMMDVGAPRRPTLVLMPRHDQFTEVDAASDVVGSWPAAELRVIESTDHFLTGRTTTVAEAAGDWLVAWTAAMDRRMAGESADETADEPTVD